MAERPAKFLQRDTVVVAPVEPTWSERYRDTRCLERLTGNCLIQCRGRTARKGADTHASRCEAWQDRAAAHQQTGDEGIESNFHDHVSDKCRDATVSARKAQHAVTTLSDQA